VKGDETRLGVYVLALELFNVLQRLLQRLRIRRINRSRLHQVLLIERRSNVERGLRSRRLRKN
jgi:hypothetical protein